MHASGKIHAGNRGVVSLYFLAFWLLKREIGGIDYTSRGVSI